MTDKMEEGGCVNRFKITNKVTGETQTHEAHYLNDAVKATGWKREDCNIEVQPLEAIADPAKKRRGRPPKDKESATPPPTPPAGQGDAVDGASAAVTVIVCSVCGVEGGDSPPDGWTADDGDNEGKKWLCVKCLLARRDAAPEGQSTGVTKVVGQPTEAESRAQSHKEEIESLAIEAEVMFLKMGQLLCNARDSGEWSILRYDSFKEYVEDLKLPMTNSYSWATRLINIYQYLVVKMRLDTKLLASIGVAKLTRLLPLARKGTLTLEVIEAARVLSDLDLRRELGQNVGGTGGTEDIVICPKYGYQFDAKKATRAD